MGDTGRTVGVEHIPELVERSIDAIKRGPAGYLLDNGRVEIHGKLARRVVLLKCLIKMTHYPYPMGMCRLSGCSYEEPFGG